MKKLLTVALAATVALGLSACGSASKDASGSDANSNVVVVGASPSPHAKILKYLETSGLAKKAGIKIEVKEFQDYVLPNKALASGDLDANYFQTVPYLEDQKKKNPDYKDFVAGKGIHLEPLALYSQKVKNPTDIKDGATIGIINDPTNQGRALKLLESLGLIKLPSPSANVAAIQNDATANPKHLVFKEVDGPQLVRTLADVDAAVINGNFAQSGGLSPKDAIAVESPKDNPAVNVLVWRSDKAKPAIKKLDELLHSPEVKAYIEKTWPDKSVIPAF